MDDKARASFSHAQKLSAGSADGGDATKDCVSLKWHFWARGLLSVVAWIAVGFLRAQATMTEVIHATGDFGGKTRAPGPNRRGWIAKLVRCGKWH